MKPYVKWEPSETSNIYVYSETGKTERLEKLHKNLNFIF